MRPNRPIVLFDLFGVIACHQRPRAMAEMADLCNAPHDAFDDAYWACRPLYDAAQQTARQYWTGVLQRLALPAGAATIEWLRRADIDSWSRVDDDMVAHVQSLQNRAEVALLSNIPADLADAFLEAQPWLHQLDLVALSGHIGVVKPDPAAFRHCITALRAEPSDFLFVDDRDENVQAAQQLGMHGHVFTSIDRLAAAIDAWHLAEPPCAGPSPTATSSASMSSTFPPSATPAPTQPAARARALEPCAPIGGTATGTPSASPLATPTGTSSAIDSVPRAPPATTKAHQPTPPSVHGRTSRDVATGYTVRHQPPTGIR
jgi:putative hydrolase of the HAD superfamily